MLLRVIIHVNDVIAWLALLRGPLVGLLLSDINYLFEDKSKIPLLEKIINYRDNKFLSEEAIYRLNYVVPLLLNAINLRENLSLPSLTKKTWISLGGEIIYPNFDLNLIDNFLFSLSKVSDFQDLNEMNRIINNTCLNCADVDPNAVQLMTIHKAKGLEFDVVILPNMDQAGNNNKNSLLLWDERIQHNFVSKESELRKLNNYLLFAPIKSIKQEEDSIYNFIKLSIEQKELNEIKRLLYVAMSRAKKKFYGFTSNLHYAHKSFFKLLAPYINQEQCIDLTQAILSKDILSSKDELLYRLPTIWYINKQPLLF